MARLMLQEADQGNINLDQASPEMYFQLGMMYSSGKSVETDLVTAHKWFNIAASRGNSQAAHYRQEIAREMSKIDIANAQRAAREFMLSMH